MQDLKSPQILHLQEWVRGLWCLTRTSTIFQLYHYICFICGGNGSIRRKPTTCRNALTNFNIYVVRIHVAMTGIRIHNLVVIQTYYWLAGSCKANYSIRSRPRRPLFSLQELSGENNTNQTIFELFIEYFTLIIK